ncbi:hypothetical protein [Flavobacterium soyangense]|uniref:LTXXQ motif family protein n=1 Tax=Flavobacterium soyangense TaxID=2023265 RepID=A0A930Y057_9FLAO|nr:hypothetical protein [Flavobacterium soyangense]MBF2708139.1 hypothetical protein [Flavobacterium soyangense]
MKKLIIAALLVIGFTAFAQDGKEIGNRADRDGMEKMSPEQRNQLMLKKMTLELDLNAKQQEQVKQIIAEQSAKRDAVKAEHMAMKQDNEKPTADEQFAMKNKMLDNQIAIQNKMKSILSPEQFKDWKSMRDKFHERNHEKREERKRE